MERTLRTEGILNGDLFKVDGDLVENYNSCLEKIIGKKTALTSFYVDKRGESPEIEAELGENYLQNSPAHRYLIVVSPEQRSSSLIHPEFSFDGPFLDKLYAEHLPALTVTTRVDGLYGEFMDMIDAYHSLEDLLLVSNIESELHTPSGFITAAKELKKLVKALQSDPNLLTAQDAEVPKKILGLAKEVGDVRPYHIDHMNVHLDVGSFSSRFFDGVYVFRETADAPVSKLKKPSVNMRKDKANAYVRILKELDEKDRAKPLDPVSTTVIYDADTQDTPEPGPKVKFIPLQQTKKVLDFLLEKEYVTYSKEILDARVDRLQDMALLDKGVAVATITAEERSRALAKVTDNMSDLWEELRGMQKGLVKGKEFDAMLQKASPEALACLVKVTADDPVMKTMVADLVTRLCPYDYEGMFQYNPRHLEHAFNEANGPTKDYIVGLLRQFKEQTK